MENQEQSRGKKFKPFFDLLPLILTAAIAVATCLAAYFSYQSVKIASELKGIQSRQEVFGYIKEFLELVAKHSKETQANRKEPSKGDQKTESTPGK